MGEAERKASLGVDFDGAPAVAVGGLSVEMPEGLYAHLAGLFLVPAALSAMLAELLSPSVPWAEVEA